MKLKIAFIQLSSGTDLNENLAKGKKACIEAKEKGADVAELDVDQLRQHRSNDIMGDKYRRPEKYGILSDVNVKGVIGGEFVHW